MYNNSVVTAFETLGLVGKELGLEGRWPGPDLSPLEAVLESELLSYPCNLYTRAHVSLVPSPRQLWISAAFPPLPTSFPMYPLLLLCPASSRTGQPREGARGGGSQDHCSSGAFAETQCSHRQAQVLRVFHPDSEFSFFLEEDHKMASAREVGPQPLPVFLLTLPLALPSPLLSCCMK